MRRLSLKIIGIIIGFAVMFLFAAWQLVRFLITGEIDTRRGLVTLEESPIRAGGMLVACISVIIVGIAACLIAILIPILRRRGDPSDRIVRQRQHLDVAQRRPLIGNEAQN